MKVRLRDAVKASRRSDEAVLARRIRHAFAFFMFGEALQRSTVEELFGDHRRASLDEGVRLGLFRHAEGQKLRMNGLSLFSRTLPSGDAVHLFADTPPNFDTRLSDQRVYIGADSYELMGRVSKMRAISGCCVEMGSGSGFQLIAALTQYPAITRAIGVERDRRALHVSLFNAALNGVGEKMAVVEDEDGLRRVINGHPIPFAMSNPPFLAMPAWMDINPEDRPAVDGLMDLRQSERGCQGDLRTLFPAAGWGGDDGLDVTRHFVETLLPLLAREGRVLIYSQWAGDAAGPRVFQDAMRTRGGMCFAFESVTSRTHHTQGRLSASEAAASVARLIVAALLARKEPRRLRVNVRKGGPEDVLMMKCARKIEDS